MNFGEALEALKAGKKVAREGWNGKDLRVSMQTPDERSKMTLPYLYIAYPDGRKCPWHASQTDILASDWSAFPA